MTRADGGLRYRILGKTIACEPSFAASPRSAFAVAGAEARTAAQWSRRARRRERSQVRTRANRYAFASTRTERARPGPERCVLRGRVRQTSAADSTREAERLARVSSQPRAPGVIGMDDCQRLIEPLSLAVRKVREHALEVLLIPLSQRSRLVQQDD